MADEKHAPSQAGDARQYRLSGTSGKLAVVGEIVKSENGVARWKIHPKYAAWLWPLMSLVGDLVLQVPEAQLEPAEKDDSVAAPSPPSEDEKTVILQLPETPTDCVRVDRLAMRGKPALVANGFPTRLANLAILRRHRVA